MFVLFLSIMANYVSLPTAGETESTILEEQRLGLGKILQKNRKEFEEKKESGEEEEESEEETSDTKELTEATESVKYRIEKVAERVIEKEVKDDLTLEEQVEADVVDETVDSSLEDHPNKPPHPPKTYLWREVKKSKEQGGYPWTHLYKDPLGPDDEQEVILRYNRSPINRRRRIEQQLMEGTPKAEKRLTANGEFEDVDIDNYDGNIEEETGEIKESSSQKTKNKQGTKEKTNDSEDKLKKVTDKKIGNHKMNIKKINVDPKEISLEEPQKILKLKESPKRARREFPHFVVKQDSDDSLEILELNESPNEAKRRREMREVFEEDSTVVPDEVIELPLAKDMEMELEEDMEEEPRYEPIEVQNGVVIDEESDQKIERQKSFKDKLKEGDKTAGKWIHNLAKETEEKIAAGLTSLTGTLKKDKKKRSEKEGSVASEIDVEQGDGKSEGTGEGLSSKKSFKQKFKEGDKTAGKWLHNVAKGTEEKISAGLSSLSGTLKKDKKKKSDKEGSVTVSEADTAEMDADNQEGDEDTQDTKKSFKQKFKEGDKNAGKWLHNVAKETEEKISAGINSLTGTLKKDKKKRSEKEGSVVSETNNQEENMETDQSAEADGALSAKKSFKQKFKEGDKNAGKWLHNVAKDTEEKISSGLSSLTGTLKKDKKKKSDKEGSEAVSEADNIDTEEAQKESDQPEDADGALSAKKSFKQKFKEGDKSAGKWLHNVTKETEEKISSGLSSLTGTLKKDKKKKAQKEGSEVVSEADNEDTQEGQIETDQLEEADGALSAKKSFKQKLKEGDKSAGKWLHNVAKDTEEKISSGLSSLTGTLKKDKKKKSDKESSEAVSETDNQVNDEDKMETDQPEEADGALSAKKSFKQKLKEGDKSAGKWLHNVAKDTEEKISSGLSSLTGTLKKDKKKKSDKESSVAVSEADNLDTSEGQIETDQPEEADGALSAKKSFKQKLKEGDKSAGKWLHNVAKDTEEKISSGLSSLTGTLKKDKKKKSDKEGSEAVSEADNLDTLEGQIETDQPEEADGALRTKKSFKQKFKEGDKNAGKWLHNVTKETEEKISSGLSSLTGTLKKDKKKKSDKEGSEAVSETDNLDTEEGQIETNQPEEADGALSAKKSFKQKLKEGDKNAGKWLHNVTKETEEKISSGLSSLTGTLKKDKKKVEKEGGEATSEAQATEEDKMETDQTGENKESQDTKKSFKQKFKEGDKNARKWLHNVAKDTEEKLSAGLSSLSGTLKKNKKKRSEKEGGAVSEANAEDADQQEETEEDTKKSFKQKFKEGDKSAGKWIHNVAKDTEEKISAGLSSLSGTLKRDKKKRSEKEGSAVSEANAEDADQQEETEEDTKKSFKQKFKEGDKNAGKWLHNVTKDTEEKISAGLSSLSGTLKRDKKKRADKEGSAVSEANAEDADQQEETEEAQDTKKSFKQKLKEGDKNAGKWIHNVTKETEDKIAAGAETLKTKITALTENLKKDKDEKAENDETMETDQTGDDSKKTFKQKLKEGNRNAGKWVHQMGKSTHDKFEAGADKIKSKVSSMTANLKKEKRSREQTPVAAEPEKDTLPIKPEILNEDREPTVEEILKEELKEEEKPKTIPRKKKHHHYEDIEDKTESLPEPPKLRRQEQVQIDTMQMDPIIGEMMGNGIKISLQLQDAQIFDDVMGRKMLGDILQQSSEDEIAKDRQIPTVGLMPPSSSIDSTSSDEEARKNFLSTGFLAPMSSIDSTSSDEEARRTHLAALTEESDVESVKEKVLEMTPAEEKLLAEVEKFDEEEPEDQVAASSSDHAVIESHKDVVMTPSEEKNLVVDDEDIPTKEDVFVVTTVAPSKIKVDTRWSNMSDHEYEPIGEPVDTTKPAKKEEPKSNLKLPADDADNISMEVLQKQIEERYFNMETPATGETPAEQSETIPDEKTSKMKKFMKQAQDSSKNLGQKVKEGSKSVGKTMQRQMSTGADKIKTKVTSMTTSMKKGEKDVEAPEVVDQAEADKMEVDDLPMEAEETSDAKKTFKQKLKDGNKSAGKWVQQVGKSTHDKLGAGADMIKTKVSAMTTKKDKPEQQPEDEAVEGPSDEPKEPKEGEVEEHGKSIQQKIKDGSKNVFQKTKEGSKLAGEKISAGADKFKTKMSSMTATLKKDKKQDVDTGVEATEEETEEAEKESSAEPSKKRFKTPDLKKIHMPEFAKKMSSDFSKLPDKFSSLRLNRSKSMKESTEENQELVESSVETPEILPGHVTTKKKMNINFGTYPRLLKDKLKRQESAPAGNTSIKGSTPPPKIDEPVLPPKRHFKPKWTEKLSEDADSERFGPFTGSEFEMEREMSVERRMREHFERMEEFEGAPMTEEQKQLEEYDKENREIHMLTQARQEEMSRRKPPMERQESDLASEEERQFWASSLGQKIRRNIDANGNDSDYLDEVEKLAIAKDKLSILVPEPKSREYVDDLGNISDQENASSGGSSSARRRKGVLEEIDDDEFFLRKRGVSEGNSEIGHYISTAIKEGLTSDPVNALAEMGRYDQYYDDEENKLKGRYKYYQPSFESDDLSHENVPTRPYYDNFFQSYPPNRPTRKSKKFEDDEDLPYDEEIRYYENEKEAEPEIIADEEEDKALMPVFVPPTPPRRRKKKFRDLTPVDQSKEDIFLRTPVQQNGSTPQIVMHAEIEAEVIIPLAEEERFTIPTPSPRRSRSRSQLSNRIEDDRTSRGAESFILDSNEVISDEKFTIHLPVDANNGYAVIKKDRSPSQPRPNAPVRRKKSTRSLGERPYNTLPHYKPDSPVRPSRNYSTINPNRPPRSKSFSENKDKADTTQYEVIDDVDSAIHKALQSGDVVNKMKDRPLPPPPRPPRDSRSKSKSKKIDDEDLDFGGGAEKLVSELKQIKEVEAYTQTETRASDFEDYDPEVAESTQIPMKTLEELLKAEQEAELERDKQIAESLAKGLEKFRQTSQKSFSERSGRASKSPYGSRPETPAALIIERKISTPTMLQNKEETTLTKATLLMQPIDIDSFEDDLMDEEIARLDDDSYIAEIVRKYVRDTSFDKEEEELKAEEKRLANQKPEKTAISTQFPQEEALEMKALMENLAAKEQEVIDHYTEEAEIIEEPVEESVATVDHAEEVVFSERKLKIETKLSEEHVEEPVEKPIVKTAVEPVSEPVQEIKTEVEESIEPVETIEEITAEVESIIEKAVLAVHEHVFEPIEKPVEPVELIIEEPVQVHVAQEPIEEIIIEEPVQKLVIQSPIEESVVVEPIVEEIAIKVSVEKPVVVEPVEELVAEESKPELPEVVIPKTIIPITQHIEFKEEILETPKIEPLVEQIAISSVVEKPKESIVIVEIKPIEPQIEIEIPTKEEPIEEVIEIKEEKVVQEPPQRPPKKQAPLPPPIPVKEPVQDIKPEIEETCLKEELSEIIKDQAPEMPIAPPRRRLSTGEVTQSSVVGKPAQEIIIPEEKALVKGRLHLDSLEIDTLNVNSLQARKISVSEVETATTTAQSLDTTAKLPEQSRPIEIPVGLIEEIVERLRNSEQKHREEIEQKRRQEEQEKEAEKEKEREAEREKERVEKELAIQKQKQKPEEKHTSVQTDQVIEEPKPVPVQVSAVEQPKKLPEAPVPTEEVPQRPPLPQIPPQMPHIPYMYPTEYLPYGVPPQAYYQMRMSDDEAMLPQAPQRRRRIPRARKDSTSEEEVHKEHKSRHSTRSPGPSTAPQPQPTDPTIPELSGQLVMACGVAAKQAGTDLMGMLRASSKDENKRDLHIALVILIIIVAGLMAMGMSAEKAVHHHHWDYFNPPGSSAGK